MSEKSIIATFTLLGSLASYYYAKANEKDLAPYTMIGGFIGGFIGELVYKSINENQNQN